MWTSYDPHTGLILGTMTDISMTKPFPAIAGAWSARIYYIKANQARRYPPKPGSGQWKWDLASESWQFDIAGTARQQRQLRDRALARVDRVNPVWYQSLSPDQALQLQAYRQALLDLPQQAGWPQHIQWPTRPDWLR